LLTVLGAGVLTAVGFAQRGAVAVAVVNGLDEPYEVTLAGETRQVAPLSTWIAPAGGAPRRMLAKLPNGQQVEATVGDGYGFFSRIFAPSLALVVNPDGAALLAVDEHYYTVNEATPPPINQAQVFLGAPCLPLSRPDFFFQAAAESISMNKGSGPVRKTRLLHVQASGLYEARSNLGTHLSPEVFAQWTEARVIAQPQHARLLQEARLLLPPARLEALFKQLIVARPVNVDLHRHYQDWLREQGRREEALRYYEGLVEREPPEGAWHYLLARFYYGPRLQELCARALAAERPCVAARSALAYEAINQGDYAGTERLLDAMRAEESEPLRERAMRLELLWITGRHAEAWTLLQAGSDDYMLTDLAAVAARAEAANLPSWMEQQMASVAQDEKASSRAWLEAYAEYGRGAPDKVLALARDAVAKAQPESAAPFFMLIAGEHAAAHAHWRSELQTVPDHLLAPLLLTAWQANDSAAMTTYGEQLEASLRNSSLRNTPLLDRLQANQAPAAEELAALAGFPSEQACLYAALGCLHPAAREACWARARALNQRPLFPRHLIKAVCGQ
jgi:hypothetical protein